LVKKMETKKEIIKKKNIKLKDKQKEILLLIYRYRFLSRIQIQSLLQHKQYNRVIKWLNELSDNKYLVRYYLKSINSKPAVYSLGSNGRKYLRENAKVYKIQVRLLNRIWYEKNTTYEFRNRLQFIAHVYLSLLVLTKKTGATVKFYTAVDLEGMKYLPHTLPDCYFSITEKSCSSKRFFLVTFRPNMIDRDILKRVSVYFSYYKRGYWQRYNKNPFPEIIFITAELKTKYFLINIIKNKLKKYPRLNFLLATQEDVYKFGINKKVLQKVVL